MILYFCNHLYKVIICKGRLSKKICEKVRNISSFDENATGQALYLEYPFIASNHTVSGYTDNRRMYINRNFKTLIIQNSQITLY